MRARVQVRIFFIQYATRNFVDCSKLRGNGVWCEWLQDGLRAWVPHQANTRFGMARGPFVRKSRWTR